MTGGGIILELILSDYQLPKKVFAQWTSSYKSVLDCLMGTSQHSIVPSQQLHYTSQFGIVFKLITLINKGDFISLLSKNESRLIKSPVCLCVCLCPPH
jgi:hypothetical protein